MLLYFYEEHQFYVKSNITSKFRTVAIIIIVTNNISHVVRAHVYNILKFEIYLFVEFIVHQRTVST
jgi:hypothetical protein